jgi:hypothetical protein
MADAKKCENPACTCTPPKADRFCGSHCEALEGAVEVVCQCGHASCGEDALSPATQGAIVVG